VENPNTKYNTIPIEECTPLASIPGNISYTSQELGMDDVVVVVGEYYYNHKTRDIERRINKRKRGESTLKQESSERSIKWKVGKDPKENVIQTTSTLNAFVGANVMSVYEIGEALDVSRARVVELEVVYEHHQRQLS
jgi:hypothetical protein